MNRNNTTHHAPSPYFTVFLVSLNSLQILATVFGNLLLFVAVYRVHDLRTLANALLVSLSVADLLFVGVFGSNIVLHTSAKNADQDDALCYGSGELFHALICVVVLHLMAIAVDRLLAITLHLRYQQVVTKGRVAIAIAAIWLVGIAEAIVPPLLMSETSQEHTKDYRRMRRGCISLKGPHKKLDRDAKKIILAQEVVVIIVPYLVILVCYAWIFKIAWRHYREVHSQNRGVAMADRHSDMKAAKTTAIIMGSFVVMFTPLLGVSVHRVFAVKRPTSPEHFKFYVMPCLKCLASMCALVNPPIYAWRNKPFREAFGTILKTFRSSLSRCAGRCVSSEKEENGGSAESNEVPA